MFSPPWDNTGVTITLDNLISNLYFPLFDFDYPVPAAEVTYNGKTAKVPFDKKVLEQKIIDHYRFRQIGQETPGRFKHYLKTRMREIMPYYVQLYEFEAKWFNIDDPLESYNLSEVYTEKTTDTGKTTDTTNSDSTGTSNTNQTNERRFSDTPQGSIDNLDSYMTEATRDTGNGSETSTGKANVTGSGTSEGSGTKNYNLTRRGNIGVQPLGSEVQNIREAFINIDMMIINDLKDLFLQVY